MTKREYQKTYIQFRTFIYQAKKVYGYLRITKEGLEGEYIRLNKKDLLNRLDSLYLKDKDNWLEEIDIDAFHFHTKEGKVLFVLETSNSEVSAYSKSSTLGIPYGLKEMNIYDAEGKKLTKSVGQTTARFIRSKGSETRPALEAKSQRQIREIITRQDGQAEKNCK